MTELSPDDPDGDKLIYDLSKMTPAAYERRRKDAARQLNMRVDALDKIIKHTHAEAEEGATALPHWNVEPWETTVDGGRLLDEVAVQFKRYIVLPKGAAEALALWTLHAWTMDAGEVSPFMVLVSPTKRCGKTSVLIILTYLTPKSELASNISPSALFRYVEGIRPTLLIDEADSFVKDNEELRGILNSGHTKPAAYVIRNVEMNGEHKPRRFSTWAPKAIATIRDIKDTLEDRSIIVTLQRKAPGANVERLRKRDCDEFATLRRQAARWCTDNFDKLTDPEPDVPDNLHDRAADNWRPLLAIADLAGGDWPRKARDAARKLSGEQSESAVNVELLADIRTAFGDQEAVTSAGLVAALVKDPERPWATWGKGDKPLTQKQLGGLLRPFRVASETVSLPNQRDAKGYKRVRFEEAWSAYCPGQNTPSDPKGTSEASKRRNADELGTTRDLLSVATPPADASENSNLTHSHAGSDASTVRKPKSDGSPASSATDEEPPLTAKPSGRNMKPPRQPAQVASRVLGPDDEIPDDDLNIPTFLRRTPFKEQSRAPALGPPGDSLDDFK